MPHLTSVAIAARVICAMTVAEAQAFGGKSVVAPGVLN